MNLSIIVGTHLASTVCELPLPTSTPIISPVKGFQLISTDYRIHKLKAESSYICADLQVITLAYHNKPDTLNPSACISLIW